MWLGAGSVRPGCHFLVVWPWQVPLSPGETLVSSGKWGCYCMSASRAQQQGFWPGVAKGHGGKRKPPAPSAQLHPHLCPSGAMKGAFLLSVVEAVLPWEPHGAAHGSLTFSAACRSPSRLCMQPTLKQIREWGSWTELKAARAPSQSFLSAASTPSFQRLIASARDMLRVVGEGAGSGCLRATGTRRRPLSSCPCVARAPGSVPTFQQLT